MLSHIENKYEYEEKLNDDLHNVHTSPVLLEW
jgi:hypothetical protein